MSLLLTLNIFHTFFYRFNCWLWTSKCLLGSVVFNWVVFIWRQLLKNSTYKVLIYHDTSKMCWRRSSKLTSDKYQKRGTFCLWKLLNLFQKYEYRDFFLYYQINYSGHWNNLLNYLFSQNTNLAAWFNSFSWRTFIFSCWNKK